MMNGFDALEAFLGTWKPYLTVADILRGVGLVGLLFIVIFTAGLVALFTYLLRRPIPQDTNTLFGRFCRRVLRARIIHVGDQRDRSGHTWFLDDWYDGEMDEDLPWMRGRERPRRPPLGLD